MNGSDGMKMKLLDDLEAHMDAHDGDAYMNKRNPQVAMMPESIPGESTARSSKIGRNDPCPCGSGKKFKRCCYTGPKTRP